MENPEELYDQTRRLDIGEALVIGFCVFIGVISSYFALFLLFKGMTGSPQFIPVLIGVFFSCILYRERGLIVGTSTSIILSLLFFQFSDSLAATYLNPIVNIFIGVVFGWLYEREFIKSEMGKKVKTKTPVYPAFVKTPAYISIALMVVIPFIVILQNGNILRSESFPFLGYAVISFGIGFILMLVTLVTYAVWLIKNKIRKK